MGFALDLRAFATKTDARANAVVRKVVFDVGTSLVLKSPVGDPSYWASPAPKGYVGGRFRANWQYGENTPKGGQLGTPDPSGAATTERILASVGIQAAGKVHYLTNNLAYANRLEEGWSRQAPEGMVDLTVLEFQPIVARAVAAQAAGNYQAGT